ncbi:uncharacterized protein [Vulpes vulpes]|uniref:Basic proline-rich protein-like n=1 Tax=Vulpes vulpes TaxID=9627 RepID=A0ABM4ZI08_VULVU
MAGRRGRAAANAASAPGGRAAAARSAEIPASVPPPRPSSPEGTRPPRRPEVPARSAPGGRGAAGGRRLVFRGTAARPHPLRPRGAALGTRSPPPPPPPPPDRRPPTDRAPAPAALSGSRAQSRRGAAAGQTSPRNGAALHARGSQRGFAVRQDGARGRSEAPGSGRPAVLLHRFRPKSSTETVQPTRNGSPGRSPAELGTGPERGPRTPRKVLWLLTLPLGLEKRPPSGFLSLLHHCNENVRWPLRREVFFSPGADKWLRDKAEVGSGRRQESFCLVIIRTREIKVLSPARASPGDATGLLATSLSTRTAEGKLHREDEKSYPSNKVQFYQRIPNWFGYLGYVVACEKRFNMKKEEPSSELDCRQDPRGQSRGRHRRLEGTASLLERPLAMDASGCAQAWMEEGSGCQMLSLLVPRRLSG